MDTKEYYKGYYLENKEKMDKNSKDWKKQNKEKWNKYQAQKAKERYWRKKLEKENLS